jgi:hypothetical protein
MKIDANNITWIRLPNGKVEWNNYSCYGSTTGKMFTSREGVLI